MKRAVKIFAFILAAAFCAGLFSCANSPIPPVVTDTKSVETTGVPDTTAAPDTTGAPETAAPETKPAETKSAETTAPETKPVETIVPVTAPAVTTVPETIQTSETTESEPGPWNVTGNGFLLTGYWQDTDPDDLPTGILEPFYRIDKNTVGVRGFDEIRLSVFGTYVDAKETSSLLNFQFLMPPEYRAFALTELPEVLPRPDAFALAEEVKPQDEYILHLSDRCLLNYSNQLASGVHIFLYVMNDPHRYTIYPAPTLMPAEQYFIPISKSEGGKEVCFAYRYECERFRPLYPHGYTFTSIVDFCRITLSDDLESIVSIDSLMTLRPGKTQQLVFNGQYGFLSACTMTVEENGTATNYYTFFGTADGGKTWVSYDPQTPDTPELTATRPGKEWINDIKW